jgi:hypothetical protein
MIWSEKQMENVKDIQVMRSRYEKGMLLSDLNIGLEVSFENLFNRFRLYEDDYTGWILRLMNGVIIGSGIGNLKSVISGNNSIVDDIRLFSLLGEIHIWRNNGRHYWRLRVDNEGEEENTYNEYHYVRCKDNLPPAGYDDSIFSGCTVHKSIHLDRLPEKYMVRNYFTYNEMGIIHFNDARIVKLL